MLAVGKHHHQFAVVVDLLQLAVDIHAGVFWFNRQRQERAAGILSDHCAHLARGKHHLIGARRIDGAREEIVAQHAKLRVLDGDFLYAVRHIHPYFAHFLLGLDNACHTALECEAGLRGHHLDERSHFAVLVLYLRSCQVCREVVGQWLERRYRNSLCRQAHPAHQHHHQYYYFRFHNQVFSFIK